MAESFQVLRIVLVWFTGASVYARVHISLFWYGLQCECLCMSVYPVRCTTKKIFLICSFPAIPSTTTKPHESQPQTKANKTTSRLTRSFLEASKTDRSLKQTKTTSSRLTRQILDRLRIDKRIKPLPLLLNHVRRCSRIHCRMPVRLQPGHLG
jgi:hypothetical protein